MDRRATFFHCKLPIREPAPYDNHIQLQDCGFEVQHSNRLSTLRNVRSDCFHLSPRSPSQIITQSPMWSFGKSTSREPRLSQNEAVKRLLETAHANRELLSLPDLKNHRVNGDTIASHTKIISNLRKSYRKSGRDILCHETHFMQGNRLIANHTRYELVDGIR